MRVSLAYPRRLLVTTRNVVALSLKHPPRAQRLSEKRPHMQPRPLLKKRVLRLPMPVRLQMHSRQLPAALSFGQTMLSHQLLPKSVHV